MNAGEAVAAQAQEVLGFWFGEPGSAGHGKSREAWFRKDAAFDAEIRRRFLALHARAALGELERWRDEARTLLALVIVLDQFSRNVYRDRAEGFAADGMALALAQEAVRGGFDAQLAPGERAFVYMPYMPSESGKIHQDALRLFDQPGLANNLDFERRHHAIIARFGRYPHRNAILGRESSAEELAFLQQPGSSF